MLMLQLWHIVMDLGTEPFPGAIFHHLECILHKFLGWLMGPTSLDCVLETRSGPNRAAADQLEGGTGPLDHRSICVWVS